MIDPAVCVFPPRLFIDTTVLHDWRLISETAETGATVRRWYCTRCRRFDVTREDDLPEDA